MFIHYLSIQSQVNIYNNNNNHHQIMLPRNTSIFNFLKSNFTINNNNKKFCLLLYNNKSTSTTNQQQINSNSPSSNLNIHDTKLVIGPLNLTTTFNRHSKTLEDNVIFSKLSSDSKSNINLYCCGPTVYDHSHLGHALTYIRCDLIIRTLRTFCNKNVFFAMNITDIDDKIIVKSKETGINYIDLANEYYQSFLNDMNDLQVNSSDCYLKVTDKIGVICDYIRQIYDKGFAYYSTETGDINFDYQKFTQSFSIDNDIHRERDKITDKSKGKKSSKDFTLWKASRENEPSWPMNLNSKLSINGRPG